MGLARDTGNTAATETVAVLAPQTGGTDSASGGSGGSGMECMQLRSQPEPFHYLISEQAKSLVALQELQNEVGALLEFRDLVIETFPNLRSKMAPSTPASGARRDWEPGVRVRRKLAGGGGDSTRAKPQPSVQDSGFSTETSCGKDAQSSSATRSRPLEDELWALLDVIQRKGVRLRDEAELLRGELDERPSGDTAEESFARALSGCGECSDVRRLRGERDALLSRTAQLEAEAAASPPRAASSPLGRLDRALGTPPRPPRVPTPDSKKFAAILHESNPVELQRQLLSSTVQNQVLREWMSRAVKHRTSLLERLEQARDLNEDLKFRLEEKTVELDSVKSRVRQLEDGRGPGSEIESGGAGCRSRGAGSPERRSHSSMRDMQPVAMPSAEGCATPRRRPSRIPLHTAHAAPALGRVQRRALAALAAARARAPPAPARKQGARPSGIHVPIPKIPAERSQTNRVVLKLETYPPCDSAPSDSLTRAVLMFRFWFSSGRSRRGRRGGASRSSHAIMSIRAPCEEWARQSLAAEYVARAERLFSRLRPAPPDLALAYESPRNLALELTKSILYENADSIDAAALDSLRSGDSLWNGKPQQYFESMHYADGKYDCDSLSPPDLKTDQ